MSFDPVVKQNGIIDILGLYPNPFTGRPATSLYKRLACCDFNDEDGTVKECNPTKAGWSKYPPWLLRYEFLYKIKNNQIILFIAGTGLGKTVIVPKLVAHYFNYETPVICTTPRTDTTVGAAVYASLLMDVPIYVPDLEKNPKGEIPKKNENGTPLETGELYVGFSYGDDKTHQNKTTKLLFCTDGTIKSKILGDDPYLSKYGAVIVDEAHERNTNIDILLSLLCNIARVRPEFRIVIMSATVSEDLFIDYFKNKQKFGDKFTVMNIMKSPLVKGGTQYPVKEKWIERPIIKNKDFETAFEEVNKIIYDKNSIPGNILVFLKGSKEIDSLETLINNKYDEYPPNNKPYPAPLIATLAQDIKDIAIKKDGLETAIKKKGKPYHTKVILSTSMAESSITFGGTLSYVIDTGLLGEPIYHPEIDATSNDKLYVNNAAIVQRCGRVGRKSPGFCIHTYTEYYQKNLFLKYAIPGIRKVNFTKSLLDIMSIPTNQKRLSYALEFIKIGRAHV